MRREWIRPLSWALVAVVLAAAWGRSRSGADAVVAFGPGGRPAVVCVGRGVVYVAFADVPFGRRRALTLDRVRLTEDEFDGSLPGRDASDPDQWWHGRAGFLFAKFPLWTGRAYAASAPIWAAAIFPVYKVGLWVAGSRSRRRRRRLGLCLRCGYDRRGLPAGGRCPECGAAAPVGGRPAAAV